LDIPAAAPPPPGGAAAPPPPGGAPSAPPQLFATSGEVLGEEDEEPDPLLGIYSEEEEEMEIPQKEMKTRWDHDHPPEQIITKKRQRIQTQKFLEINLTVCGVVEPTTRKKAMKTPERKKWNDAEKQELENIREMGMYKLVPRPRDKNVVKNRFVYKIKVNGEGEIAKFKARLVAKGFTQKFGEDFFETFASVSSIQTIRLFIALATKMNRKFFQWDVKSAYLHSELAEEIYMEQPEGYEEGDNLVWKLLKALYGLKQGGRAWWKKFAKILRENGFICLRGDSCIYYNATLDIFLLHWVDDILTMPNDERNLKLVFQRLKKSIKLQDLGECHWYLNCQIEQDSRMGVFSISQDAYVDKILEQFGMTDCKPITTPMQPGTYLSKKMSPTTIPEKEEMKKYPYRQIVGALLYSSVTSRPDITFAVNQIGRFQENPGLPHWQATKRILRYLKGTKKMKITYGKPEEGAKVFCDADLAGCKDSQKSTSRLIILFCGGPVVWKSVNQRTPALSSLEAEFVAMSLAAKETIWLKRFLEELGQKPEGPINLYTDNQGALISAKNPTYSAKTKHIDTRIQFIRQAVQDKIVHPHGRATRGCVHEGPGQDPLLQTSEKNGHETSAA